MNDWQSASAESVAAPTEAAANIRKHSAVSLLLSREAKNTADNFFTQNESIGEMEKESSRYHLIKTDKAGQKSEFAKFMQQR